MSDEPPEKVYAHLLEDSISGMVEGWDFTQPNGKTLSESADELEAKLGMLNDEFVEVARSEEYVLRGNDE